MSKVSGKPDDDRGRVRAPEPLKTPAPGACSLLIADDEHLVATGIAGLARDLGHAVVGIAADGEAALEMARRHRPQLALLDIRMPKMEGTEVAAILATELAIPSIIISAYSDQSHLDKIRNNGASNGVFGYLLKPVDLDELRVAINIALIRSAVDLIKAERIEQLDRNIAQRRTVEQAKWLLVQKRQFTEQQAHERLQKAARDQRRTLAELAQEVIQKGDLA